MSSHPKGMPPRQDGLQIDISKTDTIVCENCGTIPQNMLEQTGIGQESKI